MSVVNVIEEFILTKKNEFLDKEVAKEIKNKKDKSEEVIKLAKEKHQPSAELKYQTVNWFLNSFKKIKANVTTHPPKFINSKINEVTNVTYYGKYENDGFVKTGNVKLNNLVDVSGNSATNKIIYETYQLLDTNVGDDKKVIDFFKDDDMNLKKYITNMKIDFDGIKSKFNSVYEGDGGSINSHTLIKQIYFPVIDGYNLLSILPPSILMFEIKNRIDSLDIWLDDKHIRSYKKEGLFYEGGFNEIVGITKIGFSHSEFTKMGNVSYLNVKNKGISYLLSSMPPKLKAQDIRLPKINFFTDCLWPNLYKESFESLNNLLSIDANNINIRNGRDNIILYIYDRIIEKIWTIRKQKSQWSNAERFSGLDLNHKKILDNQYKDNRLEEAMIINDFNAEMARWIIRSYKKVIGKNASAFADDEIRHVNQLISKNREGLI